MSLALVIVLAVVVRLAAMSTGLARLDDPDQYLTLAWSIASGQGLSLNGQATAYRPPLYPILLAPLTHVFKPDRLAWGVGGLHLILGALTVWLTARAARGIGLSSDRGLAAAAIVALDPVLVFQSRSVMTETPAAFLVALTLAALAVPGLKGSFLGGISLGLASLCRPSLLPWAMLIGLAGLVVGPGPRTTRVMRSVALLAALLATLAPWAVRNALIFGEPVWTTTHGGYTLALANNPAYYADVVDGPPGAVWSGPNQARWFAGVGRSTVGMSEPEADRVLRGQALRMLRERPATFFRASVGRLGRFWGLAPSGAVYPIGLRLATALWTGPLWLAVGIGLFRGPIRAWPRVAAPCAVIALTLVHTIYWTDLRMRAPIVPALALIASGAFLRRSENPRHPDP